MREHLSPHHSQWTRSLFEHEVSLCKPVPCPKQGHALLVAVCSTLALSAPQAHVTTALELTRAAFYAARRTFTKRYGSTGTDADCRCWVRFLTHRTMRATSEFRREKSAGARPPSLQSNLLASKRQLLCVLWSSKKVIFSLLASF